MLDETVIRVNTDRYWLFAAVDPETNTFLHVRLFPGRTTAIAGMFLDGLLEKHDASEAVFLVDEYRGRKPLCTTTVSDFDTSRTAIGTASNVFLKR